MDDKELNPQESLALIESMINRVKNRFSEDGFQYILWGWIVFICAIAQFILVKFFQSDRHYLVWHFIWVAVIIQATYVWRKKKERKVKTYTDEIIFYIWIAYLVMAFLFSYVIGAVAGVEYYRYISPIMLTSYGMPVFLSGVVLRFKPLIFGGIACWIFAPFSIYLSFEYSFLTPAAAMLVAWIIPGYMLRKKSRMQTVSL